MNNKLKSVLLMIISAMAFSAMSVVIAFTADRVPLFEQLFFRNLIASIIVFINLKKAKLPMWGSKGNRKLLILRSVTGYIGMTTLFYASAHGNQGDVAIMVKMSPFIVSALAFLFLKEKITKYQKIGLIVAFVGAFFVSNPEFNSNLFPIFVAFLSAIFSGIAYTLVSALKGREEPLVIIFFFSVFSTLATIPFALINFVPVSLMDFGYLLLIGGFAAIGQITLTYSYAVGKASEVSIYNYSGIIFSMIFGFLFLNQSVKSTSAIGAVLVIISGLIVYFGNRKMEKNNM